MLTNAGCVQSTKEVLLEHLYHSVYFLQPQRAAEVTGSYSHLSVVELQKLLGDKELLRDKVSESLQCFREKTLCHSKDLSSINLVSSDNTASHGKEDLGRLLFDEVSTLEPELCSQITGMLLEQDMATIYKLLQDTTLLTEAVASCRYRYKQIYLQQSAQSNKEQKLMAEELFKCIGKSYPDNAAKLTGMLLEVEQETLYKIKDDSQLLYNYIELCKSSLQETKQWIK